MMKFALNPKFENSLSMLKNVIDNFETKGEDFCIGKRNKIKIFQTEHGVLNVKSFKKPNLLNAFVYRNFRKSKAKRSFEYASYLAENQIGTPNPIGYFEYYNFLGLTQSFYISEHLLADFTFRELVSQPEMPDHENVLRQFTKFCFELHEKGIEFLDHSPGNTLIIKGENNHYHFYLVDLNRMKFHAQMDFDLRMKNLRRLTPKKEMIAVMSNEYAKLYGKPEAEVFSKMWHETEQFQAKFHRKKALKKKLKFWKK